MYVSLYENKTHLLYVKDCTRQIGDEFVYKLSEKGPQYCIIGAGIYQTVHGRVTGDWVPDSVIYWEALRKKESKKRRGAVPEGAGYYDSGEYHGNFTVGLFNKMV